MRFKRLFFWTLLLLFILAFMSMDGLADEYKEVQASEILTKIENGEDVYLENCRVVGELNLNKSQLRTVPNPSYNELLEFGFSENELESYGVNRDLKVVESRICISNSNFENNLDFSNLLFKEPVCFVGVNCSSTVYVICSNFSNSTHFTESTFGDSTSFSGSTFGDFTNFSGSTFGDFTSFSGSTFGNCADFMASTFGNSTSFSGSSFGNSACFMESTFGDSSSFSGSTFGDYTTFMETTFGGSTDFSDSNFGDFADLRKSNFSNTSSFEWANFVDSVDFSDSQFKKVTFNDADFEEMQISWNSLEDSLVFDGPTYVKLIKNFRDLEQFEDADSAYFQYRKNCQAEKSWIPFSKEGSKWWDIVMCFTCGYGVKPFRAFYSAILIIFLFSSIYRGFPTISWRNRGDLDIAQKSPIKTLLSLIPEIDWPNSGISRLSDNKDSVQKVTFWDSFYFSMGTFSTIGYGDWYPKDNFRKFVMFEGFLGWITLGLFLVTLTNVMMRP